MSSACAIYLLQHALRNFQLPLKNQKYKMQNSGQEIPDIASDPRGFAASNWEKKKIRNLHNSFMSYSFEVISSVVLWSVTSKLPIALEKSAAIDDSSRVPSPNHPLVVARARFNQFSY